MTNRITHREQAEHTILSLLPNRVTELERLRVLSNRKALPVITVVGKYNHGKSRLLNELIGDAVFSVADKRETVGLSEVTHDAVRWLDAPGLDADVHSQDDDYARQAIWLHADIRLIVHASKEGELDSAEKDLIEQLIIDNKKTQRKNLFVLSQIDQLNDENEIKVISNAINKQIPTLFLHPVSAIRHQKGIEENKSLFVGKSGIPLLKDAINEALSHVSKARDFENTSLLQTLETEITALKTKHEAALNQLQEKLKKQRQAFDDGLIAALDKVAHDLEETVFQTGVDQALIPDATKDILHLTAGKLERSRLQVAYSHAIKHLSSYLVAQGVVGIPSEQRVAASGLNNVMVAVLGVSVKYRKDLHRLFFEEKGRQSLQKDFAHYYELSENRAQLKLSIEKTSADFHATENALQAFAYLESC